MAHGDLGALYEQVGHLVLRRCQQILRNPEEAMDAVQWTFVRAIETGFEVSCLVADFIPEQSELPARDSAFTSHANEVTVFRGVTWLEMRPDLGPEHSIQFSGSPGLEIPETAVAKCDFTDAMAIQTEGAAMIVRIALRPGWLEVVTDEEEVAKFLDLRGFP